MNPTKLSFASTVLGFFVAASLVACGAGRSQLVSYDPAAAGGWSADTGGQIATGGVRAGGQPGAGGWITTGGVRSGGQLPSTGGGLPTGGVFVTTGGSVVRTGGSVPGTGGFILRSGGSVPGTGGLILRTGGSVPGTGGFILRTGGSVVNTGGSVIRTGGSVIRTGGIVIRTGGSVPGTGGFLPGSGGVVMGTGGAIQPPDAGICGPVCDIFCLYGNKLDAQGCPLCECNPPPDASVPDTQVCPTTCQGVVCPYGFVEDANGCPLCRCLEGPNGCPAIMCKPCPFGIVQDEKGCYTCECIPDPSIPCNKFTYSSTCNASPRKCQWLSPGCDTPALTTSGCFDPSQLDCNDACPDELTCLKRSVNPCPTGNCSACGEYRAICL